jgi:hypothetical protein
VSETPGVPSGKGQFAGELGLLGLFDLGQLLLLNGATGCLVVNHEGRRGYLHFDGGRIVNAVDDRQHEGEGAAYEIFTWKTGRFEFRPEPVGEARVIEEGTEALMLEAARRMDEASEAAGGGGRGEAEKLLDRQGAMDALREVFRSVAREAASDAGEAAAVPASLLLAALRDADDRLLCRPGRPPRLFHDGSWLVAAESPLGPEIYAELRERLGDGTRGPDAADAASRTLTLESGATVSVSRVVHDGEEALWVRLAHLSAPDPSLLDGPLDRLNAMLDVPQGVVLAAAPTLDAVERLLNALVAQVVRRRPGAVLLAAATPTYRHREAEGVVIAVPPAAAEAALVGLTPGTAAFDARQAAPAALVRALCVAPLVIAGVLSADAASAPARWLAGLGPQADAVAALIATVPVGVAYTPGLPFGEDRIPFTAAFVALGPTLPAVA